MKVLQFYKINWKYTLKKKKQCTSNAWSQNVKKYICLLNLFFWIFFFFWSCQILPKKAKRTKGLFGISKNVKLPRMKRWARKPAHPQTLRWRFSWKLCYGYHPLDENLRFVYIDGFLSCLWFYLTLPYNFKYGLAGGTGPSNWMILHSSWKMQGLLIKVPTEYDLSTGRTWAQASPFNWCTREVCEVSV